MKKIPFLLFAFSALLSTNAQTLNRGTVVPVKFTSTIDSKNPDEPAVIVNADVKAADGTTIIKYGTPVQTEIKRQKAKGCGRPGSLSVKFVSTQTVDGQFVILEGGKLNVEGNDKKGLAIGLGVGLGVWVWPGLFCLAIKGEQATIEEGTTSTSVLTVQDITLK